jgi:hypothetical protein
MVMVMVMGNTFLVYFVLVFLSLVSALVVIVVVGDFCWQLCYLLLGY